MVINNVTIFKFVIKNKNSWVLFEHGTVVIFLPEEMAAIPGEPVKVRDLRAEAVKRLKSLKVKNVAVAELVGQGQGWIVNCGDDFILNYVPHGGDYPSRYERMAAIVDIQKQDQQGLNIIHVEKK